MRSMQVVELMKQIEAAETGTLHELHMLSYTAATNTVTAAGNHCCHHSLTAALTRCH